MPGVRLPVQFVQLLIDPISLLVAEYLDTNGEGIGQIACTID